MAFDVPLRTFFSMRLVEVGDVVTGLVKCIAYGAAIPVVSGYCGLSTFGGSEGVGWATTRAVVSSSLAVIMLNVFISIAAFIVFPSNDDPLRLASGRPSARSRSSTTCRSR